MKNLELKNLIKEEITKVLKEEDEAVDVKNIDKFVDVKNIDKFLPKINTKAEYMELLPKVLNLDVPGVTPSMKKIALRDYIKSLMEK